MPKVTYLGSSDPTEDTVCEVAGVAFTQGVPVDLKDVPPKLRTNPMFHVEGGDFSAFDPDGDGAPGGVAPPAEEGEKAELQAALRDLGVRFHPNAGVPKLRAALDEATAPHPQA